MIKSFFTLLRRLRDWLRQVLADVRELEERRALLDRPWEEDLLNWARGDQGWQLHGQTTAAWRNSDCSAPTAVVVQRPTP